MALFVLLRVAAPVMVTFPPLVPCKNARPALPEAFSVPIVRVPD